MHQYEITELTNTPALHKRIYVHSSTSRTSVIILTYNSYINRRVSASHTLIRARARGRFPTECTRTDRESTYEAASKGGKRIEGCGRERQRKEKKLGGVVRRGKVVVLIRVQPDLGTTASRPHCLCDGHSSLVLPTDRFDPRGCRLRSLLCLASLWSDLRLRLLGISGAGGAGGEEEEPLIPPACFCDCALLAFMLHWDMYLPLYPACADFARS